MGAVRIDHNGSLVCRHTMKGLEKAREEMDSGSAVAITSASLGDVSNRTISTASGNLVKNGVREIPLNTGKFLEMLGAWTCC